MVRVSDHSLKPHSLHQTSYSLSYSQQPSAKPVQTLAETPPLKHKLEKTGSKIFSVIAIIGLSQLPFLVNKMHIKEKAPFLEQSFYRFGNDARDVSRASLNILNNIDYELKRYQSLLGGKTGNLLQYLRIDRTEKRQMQSLFRTASESRALLDGLLMPERRTPINALRNFLSDLTLSHRFGIPEHRLRQFRPDITPHEVQTVMARLQPNLEAILQQTSKIF